jgi:FixJ family two-component response regulator
VLDLKIAEIGGFDVQEILSHGDGCLPVIFVSGQADIEASVRAMKAGAIDFLTKPFEYRQMTSAIDTALILSEQNLVKRDKLRKDQEAFVSLTPRERDVCIRIAQGLLNKQVGFELGTKEKTVKQQRARVMQKLGAASLPDIVRFIDRLRIAGAIPESRHQSHL